MFSQNWLGLVFINFGQNMMQMSQDFTHDRNIVDYFGSGIEHHNVPSLDLKYGE